MTAKRAEFYLLTALLLPLVIFGLIKHIASPVTGFAEDDSWFYAQIAYSWPRSGFATFDGIHETSGFHLLWGAILACVSWCVSLFSDDKVVHATAYISVYILIVQGVVDLATARIQRRAWILLPAFCTLIFCAFLMETALLTLVLLHVGRLLDELEEGPSQGLRWRRALLGCTCVLVPLCRLDATLIPLIWGALDRRRLTALPVLLGSTAGALMQLGAMRTLFGHWFSVSSMLKVSYAIGGTSAPVGETLNVGTVYRVGLALALSLAAAFSLKHHAEKSRRVRCGALVAVVCFSLGHIVLGSARSWYFLPLYGICWWIMSAPAFSTTTTRRQLSLLIASRMAIVLVVGSVVWKGYRYVASQKASNRSWNFVEHVAELVPQNGLIYEIDASGFPGYWSNRNVINGDGLVNSYTYARQLSLGKLDRYLEEEGICWLIVTSRVVDPAPGILLNFNGLVVKESEVAALYPTGKIKKKGTQLVAMISDHCR